MLITRKSLESLKLLVPFSKIHSSSILGLFWVEDKKGGYKSKEPLPPLSKRIPEGLREIKKEIALFRQEFFDSLHGRNMPLLVRPGEIDVKWRFEDEINLENWVTSADSDNNEGYSTCNLTLTKNRKGLFSGVLSTTLPKDGRISRTGYCNLSTKPFRKSFKREYALDWTNYNVLNMRVRGDGRSYFVNVGAKGYFDITWNDMYHYIMFTRGGPYWETIRIPFSKFFFSSNGRIQDKQQAIPLHLISNFSFTLADKVNGPFNLEIDYIGLEYDPNHTEEFAYEMYTTDANITGH